MDEKILLTENLSAGYGQISVLSGVNLDIAPGEILTLIGPNGAGKSTLLKSIAGELALREGRVLYAGKDYFAQSLRQRAQTLAFMQTHHNASEMLTCGEYVGVGRYPYTGRLGILTPHDRQKVTEALLLVGAAELAERPFHAISDGQRQRILLARAIAQEPKVILLDEPTSFLDIKGKIELLQCLKRLAEEKQTAVILSLHELELAGRISDRIACVEKGTIGKIGKPEEILTDENIAALYGLEKGWQSWFNVIGNQ